MHGLQHAWFGFVWEVSGLQPKKSHVIKRGQVCLPPLLPSVLVAFCACRLLLCDAIELRGIDASFHIGTCWNWLLCQVCCQGECFAVSCKMAGTSQKWCLSPTMFLEAADGNVFISQLCLSFQQLPVQLFAPSFPHCFGSNLQRPNSACSCNNITLFKVTDPMASWLAVPLSGQFKVTYLSSPELWFTLWKMVSCMIWQQQHCFLQTLVADKTAVRTHTVCEAKLAVIYSERRHLL